MNSNTPPPLHHPKKDQLVAENVIRAIVPRPDISLVTTFYRGKSNNDRTFFFPPILREEILSLQSHGGEHILVYLTTGFKTLSLRSQSIQEGQKNMVTKNSEVQKNKKSDENSYK